MSRQTKVVVFGAAGMLGSAMVEHLRSTGFEVVALTRTDFEIGTTALDELDLRGVSYVVNCAGAINRRLTMPGADREATAVNAVFPRQLAQCCERNGVRLLHVSTDCVYDGARGLYTEVDPPNATDLYGRTKATGEPDTCMVVRTSLIGPERRSFYSLLSWVLRQEGSCQGFTNHRWNGVTTLQFSQFVATVIREDRYVVRRQHLFAEDTTKADLITAIAQHFEVRVHVEPVLAPESKDMRLRTIYPEYVSAAGIAHLEDQLAQLKHWWIKSTGASP